MRNQVFKKLFSVLLALIMVAGMLPASAMAGGWGAMDVDTTPELTETEQPTESAEPTAPTETETPEVTEVPEPTPENPAATVEPTQGEPTEEITIAPVNEVAAQANGVTTVIAGSDFQNPNGNEAGAQTVTSILTKMQNADYTKADGFLFCGDYDYSTVNNQTRTEAGITALKKAVTGTYSTLADDRMVLVEGNHDAAAASGLATSGAHDAEKYGVYVINEDDYMWNNSDEATIKKTAEALGDYLDEKVTAGYGKPIFVVSHLPLHYSMRTKNDGDGMYANYIFDVLNEAGAAGLNIIFLYGHDHSNGWDDYLGGSSVYLAKGNQINIAQGSKTAFNVETLNFTYMNAGFTGYYENKNGADDTLTMTVFSITDDAVTVERYDANGKHNLKSAGVTNSYKNESGYDPNTAVYASPQTVALGSVTPSATKTDGNVSVTARGLTGLTAAKNTVTVDTSKYSAYASYDITPEGYTQGNTATVTITLDENDGFNASRKVTVIDQTGINPDTTVSIVDGTVTFTTTHFSTYDIAQEALAEPAERTYTLVTSETELVSGDQYLLIYNGTKFVLPEIVTRSNDSGEQRTGMDLEATDVASGGPATITGQYQAKEWQLVSSSGGWLLSNGTQQIKLTNTNNLGITATFEDAGSPFSLNFNTSHLVSFTHGNWELNYNESRGLINGYDSGSTAARMYIYRLTSEGATEPAEPTEKTIYLYVGQTRTDTIDGEYHTTSTSTNESAVTVTVNGTQGQDGQTTATEANVTCDTLIESKSESWQDTGYYYKADDGNYYRLYAMRSKKNDGRYTYTWGYRSSSDSVTEISKQTNGKDTKPNITVYNTPTTTPAVPASTTVTFTGRAAGTAIVKVGSVTYRVIVREKAQLNDYPEYPNEGSVRVEKTGQGVDFQNTGVAKIELSTTGVPMSKGVDVILMLDTSSSMKNTVDGTTRIDVLRQSVANMLATFNTPDATTGVVPNIRVAIADFNGYEVNNTNSPIYLDSKDHLTGDTIRDGTNSAKVYTGTGNYTSGAFVDASTYSTAAQRTELVNSITTASGTNYDAAFYYSYQLGQAITDANNTAGEERDLYVVFMSDGAPFQYNGFSANSDKSVWNNWLQGTSNDAASGSHRYFYNTDSNKNWWAEAIKGDTGSQYTIIDKTKNTAGTNPYMTQVSGLGAKMYSIGFCLAQDKQITVASMENVLQKIATDSSYYIKADSASDLNNAFNQIASNIKKAGYGATFTDVMGEAYDLKITPFNLANNMTVNPIITVSTYQLYKKSEIGTTVNGVTVTEAMVGTRKSDTPPVQETVSFNADGTEAYSSSNPGVNILTDNKINAKLFTYNLTTETFSWNVGDITEDEQVLSYYVYLTGSMEGERAAGSYPTNKSAVLTYKNWLDHDAQNGTVSPVMPWASANVSYAFYLVDENGTPVVNQTTGATGSFANAVKVTQPVVYSEVLLNSGAEVEANIVAQNALPAGYELYDADATYTVSVRSGDGTGSWTITKGNSAAATTYVAQYDPNNSAAVSNALLSTEVNGGQNDYTHTVVWFAVKYQISCVPDAVVIDFGLPVDISVLANDILGEGAAVMGLAAVGSIPAAQGTAELAGGFSPNGYTGTYGTATINGTKVRYTPGSMKMDNTEKFAYAAQANLENDQKYYYSTVTVIPAANIYYEDSFVTFDGAWEPVGQAKDGITQQEDRPGQFSLSAYDANNVYGFDSAYTACTEYSLGSARKVTVTSDMAKDGVVWPTAQFTFKGTGFDIISLTDNTSGAIFVDVYAGKEAKGTMVKSYIVDNYYGYTQDESGNWVVDKAAKDNAIYQIPVMQVRNLTYGEYTAVVTVFYDKAFNHTAKSEYNFWLDAVRVYDPAGTDLDNEYVKDKEGYPQYIKLRDAVANAGASLDGSKALFIDGGNTADIATYANIGPNNEVYLAQGQAITFKLAGNDLSKIATVQIGAKSPNSNETNKASMAIVGSSAKDLNTATEMYYDITVAAKTGNAITVTNNGGAILSLTNLKITFASKPDTNVTLAGLSVAEQTAAVQAVRALFAPAPIEPEPEPEPEKTFEPERFEASWSRNVMQGRKATLTVKTSEDVEAITVDGQTIRSYRTRTERVGFGRRAKRITYREFTYSMVAQESADFSVTAINAEGTESEAITVRLTVKNRPNSMRDMWDWFKGWF